MNKFSIALCGGVSLLAMAPSAFAQQAASPPQAPAAAPKAAAPAQLDVVVVTGSRIVRNGYSAPTPVTVVQAAELETLTPSTIPDALNKLPVFEGSIQSNMNATGSAVSGNFLNLRNFGANRTLILLDGLRVPATNFNGTVDVNSLPSMLLQRVDTVTGGASAVYGSDAVTGVVNFILDTRFKGLKLDAESGISAQGDAASTRYGIAVGSNVLEHGHFEGSFEHYQEGGLLLTQRSFSADRPGYAGPGVDGAPYTLVTNTGYPNKAFGGYVLTGPFAGQQFLANGQLGPFQSGAFAPNSTSLTVGGQNAYNSMNPLTVPQNENQAFGRFDYDFTNNISGFIQGMDAWTINSQRQSNYSGNINFFSGNPYLPAGAQAQLAPGQSFTANIFPRYLNLLSQQTQSENAGSLTAGLNGRFDGFKWALNYTHGASVFRDRLTNNINLPDYYAAADAVKGPNGPECYVSTTANAGLYPGCVPIDVFGIGNASQAAMNYIFQTTQWQAVNIMDDYSASISGDVFNDWAGPVSLALNAEYRQESLKETTNANPLAPVTNVKGVLRDVPSTSPIGSVYSYATVAASHGSRSVEEASIETVVPLAKDMPWIKSFDFSGAVRYTNYSTSGSVVTWKVGLDYQPNDEIRFRATESRDIRAPTLYDLYAGQSALKQFLFDPVSGFGKVINIITQGTPTLVPEVSLTTTAGFVYSPSWLPRFRMSVDYYDITIDNAITNIAGNDPTILAECADQPNAPLCTQLLVRGNGPTNFPTAVYGINLNVAKTWTQGMDIEASYNTHLADLSRRLSGDVGVRLLYSYQPVLETINFASEPAVNTAGVAGSPSNRVTLMASYTLGPVAASWQTRWNSAQETGTAGEVYAVSHLPAYTVSDLNLNYHFKVDSHAFNAFFNIQNLFDAQPQVSPDIVFSGIPGFWNPAVPGQDVIGRYFTMGVKFNY